MLNWSQSDLAKAAEISQKTVERLEASNSVPSGRSAEAIRVALEASGATFTTLNAKVGVEIDPTMIEAEAS